MLENVELRFEGVAEGSTVACALSLSVLLHNFLLLPPPHCSGETLETIS